MNVPKTSEMRHPILEYLGQSAGQGVKVSDIIEAMAKHFKLTKKAQGGKTPGGGKIFAGKVSNTVINLRDLGLVKTPRRGYVAITQKARDDFHIPKAQPEKAGAIKQRPVPFNEDADKFIQMATTITASYVANNPVHFEQIPEIIRSIYGELLKLKGQLAHAQTTSQQPAVPIENSIAPGHIICLECGQDLKSLKRHLWTHNKMTPDEYRKKWGLSPSYPMVAEKYTSLQSRTAK